MSEDKSYNGYTNYETWDCSLWIDNDEGTLNHYNERAQEIYDDDSIIGKEDKILELMDIIKSEIKDSSPLTEASMYTDLLNASISEINFYEIAENFINEVYEENKEESD